MVFLGMRKGWVLLLAFFLLSGATVSFAQDELTFEELIEDDPHELGELIPVRDTSYQETQGSVEDAFYGIIHYDIYDRAYLIEDFFPLGYSATVTYEYHPSLHETSRGWEPVVSKETGSFKRGEEQIASYVRTFDEAGEEASYTREGFSVVVPIMQAIGGILGIDFSSPHI